MGTATERSSLVADFERIVRDCIEEQLELDEGDDTVVAEHFGTPVRTGGRFQFVGDQRITIELDGDAALGWYAEGAPMHFHGALEREYGWHAAVRKYRRERRVLRLVLDVEAE